MINPWKYECPTWYPAEGSTFIGNGFIGGSMPLDGHGAEMHRYNMAMVGLYFGPNEDAAMVPHWLNVGLRLDGQTAHPSWVDVHTTLDLEHGIFSHSHHDSRGLVTVAVETFCHRGRKEIATYRMRVTAKQKVALELTPRLDASRLPSKATTKAMEGPAGLAWTLDFGDPAATVGQAIALELVGAGSTSGQRLESVECLGRSYRLELQPGATITLTAIVATAFGGAGDAARILSEATRSGYEALRGEHQRAMADLWSQCGFGCEDPYLLRKMRAAMFYLTAGYREDVIHGGAATGVSSGGSWGGSVFWDTEFYMLPALMPFFPRLVKNMLLYRHATLPAAMANAAAHGEAGARFAWQSKKTGRPVYDGGFEEERHISTDIAYATWWYGHAHGDEAFAANQGRAIILEVARNWVSRTTRNDSQGGRYEFHNVVPADEHVLDHYRGTAVNNSAFTSAYIRWCLRTAAALPGVDQQEAARFSAIAEKVFIPRDQANGIFAEYDGYDGHPLKQADVAHMFFPLRPEVGPDEIRRNCYYYLQRERETGLFLTHSPYVYGAALSRAGDANGVARMLELSFRNWTGPFEIPRESNYGGGVVVTGAGSFLNLMTYGLAGLENMGDTLGLHPCVPAELGTLRLEHVAFRGRRYTVEAQGDQGTIRAE